jgi:hypothetical protein
MNQQMNQQFEQINQQFQHMNQELQHLNYGYNIVFPLGMFNANIGTSNAPLEQIPNREGLVAEDYPNTIDDLRNLNTNGLNRLLLHYDLVPMIQKKKRFAKFIGLYSFYKIYLAFVTLAGISIFNWSVSYLIFPLRYV